MAPAGPCSDLGPKPDPVIPQTVLSLRGSHGVARVPGSSHIWSLGGCRGGRALASWGSRKHGFVEEWFRNLRLWDSPRPKWIVWYPGSIWAGWLPRQNPPIKWFHQDFPNLGKLGVGPLAVPDFGIISLVFYCGFSHWGPGQGSYRPLLNYVEDCVAHQGWNAERDSLC